MISLNNLLNHVLKSAEEYQLNNDVHKLERVNSPIKGESKKNVIIINPTFNGQGDFELARKLAELMASKDLQVNTVSLVEKPNKNSLYTNYESISEEPKKLTSKLVIIAPFSFCRPEALVQAFKDNVVLDKEMKIVMIDEIEANSQHLFKHYKNLFEEIGIKDVCEKKLGFGENCIGYLPIKKLTCKAIKERATSETKKLFDSFNLHVDFSAHYYISYLSSDVKVTASQVFIVNTLSELKDSPSSVNYIFSLGEGNWESDVERISKGACDIFHLLEEIDQDIANRFSKLNIILVDAYKNKTFDTELQNREDNCGIPINIIFMNTKQIPKNIWHNFIAISKSGIMTGDQSLCDYLSIREEMPFYEMQNWKWPLRQSLIDSAEKFGGEELKEYVQTKFFGRMPPYGDIFYKLINSSALNNKLKNDFQNFGKFLSQKIVNNPIEVCLN